jgi:lipopolysaccharide transport system permease protein
MRPEDMTTVQGVLPNEMIPHRWDPILRHLNPVALVKSLWRYRGLIAQFTRREIEGRYRSSFLGFAWSFVQPVVLLLIYTFVFGVVFKTRWPDTRTDRLSEFGLVLFCGLIAFGIFSEIVNRATMLIVSVPNYVKRVVFPLEVLVVSVLGSAVFHAFVSLSVLLTAHLFVRGQLPWTIALIPVVILPLLLLSLGLGWFLASLGVFVRDLSHVIALVVQVLMFATPIFYPLESIPVKLQPIVSMNPLTSIIENMRRVIFRTEPPQWWALCGWTVVSAIVMLLGYAWFMRTKRAFADVI